MVHRQKEPDARIFFRQAFYRTGLFFKKLIRNRQLPCTAGQTGRSSCILCGGVAVFGPERECIIYRSFFIASAFSSPGISSIAYRSAVRGIVALCFITYAKTSSVCFRLTSFSSQPYPFCTISSRSVSATGRQSQWIPGEIFRALRGRLKKPPLPAASSDSPTSSSASVHRYIPGIVR